MQCLHPFALNELKTVHSSHIIKVLLASNAFWGVTSKATNQAGSNAIEMSEMFEMSEMSGVFEMFEPFEL